MQCLWDIMDTSCAKQWLVRLNLAGGSIFQENSQCIILSFYPKCVGVCVHDPSRGIIYTYDESTTSSTLIIQGTEKLAFDRVFLESKRHKIKL